MKHKWSTWNRRRASYPAGEVYCSKCERCGMERQETPVRPGTFYYTEGGEFVPAVNGHVPPCKMAEEVPR